MPTTPLVTVPFVAPGNMGLNLQQEGTLLGPNWCTSTTNAVIDNSGRLAARKGFSSLVSRSTSYVCGSGSLLNEYVDAGGSSVIVQVLYNSSSDNTYINVDPASADILIGFTTTGTPMSYPQVHTFNNKLILTAEGYSNIYYWDGTMSSGTLTAITPAAGGTVPTGGVGCAAYGRLWLVSSTSDRQTVRYSDLLLYDTFDDATSPGSAGSIDLKTVWGDGDQITAIVPFNGQLVIFGYNTIVIYDNADDVTNLSLNEVIRGTGCISKYAVINMGADLIFLSRDGIRSFGRTLVQSKMPMQTLSFVIKDFLMGLIANEANPKNIKAAYSQEEGFIIFSFPTSKTVICMDIKEYPKAKFTTWNMGLHDPFCSVDNSLYAQSNDTAFDGTATLKMGEYSGNQDFGSSYKFEATMGWTDLSQVIQQPSLSNRLLFFKKAKPNIIAEANTSFTFYWSFDFASSAESRTKTITGSSIAEWGSAEYGVDEYSGGANLTVLNMNASDQGKLFNFGISADVDGGKISFPKLDIYMRVGRMK